MRKNTIPLIMLFILGLILTGCTIEIRTTLDNSGAGRIDISISNGEQDPTTIFSSVGMTAIELCSQDAWGDRIETDATFVLDESDDTKSCLISIPFESIAKLEGIYTGMDLTVNELSLDEGTIVYDITVDSETEAEDLAVFFQNETGVDWQVALPGEIQLDHTADRLDTDDLGQEILIWNIKPGEARNLYAISSPPRDDFIGTLIVAGFFGLLVLIGFLFYLCDQRRKARLRDRSTS